MLLGECRVLCSQQDTAAVLAGSIGCVSKQLLGHQGWEKTSWNKFQMH